MVQTGGGSDAIFTKGYKFVFGMYPRATRQFASAAALFKSVQPTPQRPFQIPPSVGVARPPQPQPPAVYITPGAGIGEDQRLNGALVRLATYEVEIQKKAAIATACLVFALLGAPIALRFQRGGVGLVIGLSVAVFSVYYIGLIGGEELGNRLIVSPFFAMWTPNLLFAVVGLIGLWRIRKPGNSPHGGDWSDVADVAHGVIRWPSAVLRWVLRERAS